MSRVSAYCKEVEFLEGGDRRGAGYLRAQIMATVLFLHFLFLFSHSTNDPSTCPCIRIQQPAGRLDSIQVGARLWAVRWLSDGIEEAGPQIVTKAHLGGIRKEAPGTLRREVSGLSFER